MSSCSCVLSFQLSTWGIYRSIFGVIKHQHVLSCLTSHPKVNRKLVQATAVIVCVLTLRCGCLSLQTYGLLLQYSATFCQFVRAALKLCLVQEIMNQCQTIPQYNSETLIFLSVDLQAISRHYNQSPTLIIIGSLACCDACSIRTNRV